MGDGTACHRGVGVGPTGHDTMICMELNHQEITSPARDAASVLMLRDGAQGLEIFMLQRHSNSAVLGGAYVFPGGKLDTADTELDPHRHLDQARDELHRQLAEPELDPARAGGLYVAALREAFGRWPKGS